MPSSSNDAHQPITTLLERWYQGDLEARELLFRHTYDELRRIALPAMRREQQGHTLGVTGLVHEVFLRLSGQALPDWQGRQHFYGFAGRLMRQVLVDHARAKRRQKRGGAWARVTLEETACFAESKPPDILQLDDALKDLEKIQPQLAAVVELHCFGGLTFDEVAAVLKISIATVMRRWRRAKAWLFQMLTAPEEGDAMR